MAAELDRDKTRYLEVSPWPPPKNQRDEDPLIVCNHAPSNRNASPLPVLWIPCAWIASLSARSASLASDSVLFRLSLQRDLSTLAEIIADNSTASLAFDDPRSAAEILGTLRARQHIAAACLFRADGSVLAHYLRSDTARCPGMPRHNEIHSDLESLTVAHTINFKERSIGALVILYDTGEMMERIRLYSLTVLIVLIVASLIVVRFSSSLRAMFATPILELADATTRVTKTKDYGIRAPKLSNDEVGNLVSAFNEMLAGIQSRDAELRRSLAERDEALTRLAQLNRELQKSNDELARSNEDLERFAFLASHDLQEPLRMVTLYSQLLVKQYGELGEDAAEYIGHIVGGTRRMRELLADLLAYTQIVAAPESELELIDLNVVIAKVKENLRMSIDETGALITAVCLPALRAQEAHMISLFQNLIGNSIKYRSGEQPRIQVSGEDAGGAYRFAVADNGVGIAPEYHARIFAAFKRLHGKDIPGTGIGLAICQRVVERYGGRIWVESEAGKGSTFLFTFPKAAAKEQLQ